MFCYNGCRDHYTLRRAWLAELERVTHCLQADIPSRCVTSQLGRLSCIPPGVAKSSTSFGWSKGGNVTSAGWQVTLCDPI